MQPQYYHPGQPQPYVSVPLHPQSPAGYPRSNPVIPKAVQAGIFGMIVVSTGAMGSDLHHVSGGKMTVKQALGHSLAAGAAGGAAAAAATVAAESLTDGGVAGVAVTLAAATGVSYLIHKITR